MQGDPDAGRDPSEAAILGCAVRQNDKRQDYLRASLVMDPEGLSIATPYELQDSSMIRVCAEAGALVIRKPNAPPQVAGEKCRIIRL
ncbi:MAG: molybdopterin molybdenumtransferase MoeA, partial [Alphaproteobacteria bacterium]|nr:molybdopterin molybdenumtransferase MoeA [Alphaproteobacteria bacterium]